MQVSFPPYTDIIALAYIGSNSNISQKVLYIGRNILAIQYIDYRAQ